MELLSWNIQCGRGVDGQVDLARIARTIRAFGDPDVICLQEVVRHMPELDDGRGLDQVAELGRLFEGYERLFGAALDRRAESAAARLQYGNLILSRRPVLQAFRHLLPQPAEPGIKHMQRQATEAVIETDPGPLRIVTTHLEFHSAKQRQAQITRLRALHQEIAANERRPAARTAGEPYIAQPRPATSILCGDFNLEPDSAEYRTLAAPFDDETPTLTDAWTALYGDKPHDPTCGLFDSAQWPQGPHCRDYFFITDDLTDRMERVAVDMETDASDHQPILLRLRP
ncbi:endonuclease/exonuclease/phosphatase family protein [Rhodospirillaceae bacterium SYSU D60014]|uniref:endonuclease/exonuclease/phosphatase family protein n=1 Tax=Virgifigura deserti TaxID=2268457 RepID=UPI000E667327